MIMWKNYEMLNKISIDFITQYGHTVSKKNFLWNFSVFRLNILNFPVFSRWHFGTF